VICRVEVRGAEAGTWEDHPTLKKVLFCDVCHELWVKGGKVWGKTA
jgi:hypothetical protein